MDSLLIVHARTFEAGVDEVVACCRGCKTPQTSGYVTYSSLSFHNIFHFAPCNGSSIYLLHALASSYYILVVVLFLLLLRIGQLKRGNSSKGQTADEAPHLNHEYSEADFAISGPIKDTQTPCPHLYFP